MLTTTPVEIMDTTLKSIMQKMEEKKGTDFWKAQAILSRIEILKQSTRIANLEAELLYHNIVRLSEEA